MKMKKRTNSVISSLYPHPIGNSRTKTSACMFTGGAILVCLGTGLIVTTMSVRPRPVPVDETSTLISGPVCLVLGFTVAALSGIDLCRQYRARNAVDAELGKMVMQQGMTKQVDQQQEQHSSKISIIISKPSIWSS